MLSLARNCAPASWPPIACRRLAPSDTYCTRNPSGSKTSSVPVRTTIDVGRARARRARSGCRSAPLVDLSIAEATADTERTGSLPEPPLNAPSSGPRTNALRKQNAPPRGRARRSVRRISAGADEARARRAGFGCRELALGPSSYRRRGAHRQLARTAAERARATSKAQGSYAAAPGPGAARFSTQW
jgi:hypothetical protein